MEWGGGFKDPSMEHRTDRGEGGQGGTRGDLLRGWGPGAEVGETDSVMK